MKKTITLISILVSLQTFSQAVITTTVNSLEVKDSLNVIRDITAREDLTVLGAAFIKGELLLKDTLTTRENIIAQKDIKVDGSMYVNQNITVEGTVNAKGGLTFDGANGLFYTPATSATKGNFQLGNKVTVPNIGECQTAQSEPWSNFYYAGNFVSHIPLGSSAAFPLVNAALRIGMAPWNGNALIDVSGVAANGLGTNGLEINTFCKRNTYINMGWDVRPASYKDGGRVFMGVEVSMQRNLKIGDDGLATIDANSAIEINQNTNNAKGVKVKTWNQSIKAFTVEWTDGKSPFTVMGNGQTYIGLQKLQTPHQDAMLAVDGKIACKSLYVLKPTSWADFVFKTTKLESLTSVEEYIKKNKHLPNVPSEKDILQNGYDINEMDATLLAKIETLYLHIIKLEKQVNELKNK